MEDGAVELADDDAEEVFEIPEDSSVSFSRPGPKGRVHKRMSRKAMGPRARTLSAKDMTLKEVREARIVHDADDYGSRPRTRGECREELRPCPYVSCKYHLYLDVNPETGSIKVNFPDMEPWELSVSCSLDVAERGGITLEEVGQIMNLTRERIRQVEVRGLLKLKMGSPSEDELGAELLRPTPLVQIRKRK